METTQEKPTVIIKRCETYDQARIMEIFQNGMAELNFRPHGKIFVKPNVVFSTKDGKYGSTAYPKFDKIE